MLVRDDKQQLTKPVRQNQRRVKPKKPRVWGVNWKPRMLRIGMLVLFLLVLFVCARALNTAFAVTHWQIDASPSMEKQISVVLQTQNLDFWHARPVVLRQKLLHAIPDLEDVMMQRQLPDSLNIQVSLRQPMGLWENEQGVVYLVDEHGVAYRALKQGENVDLPMLRMRKQYLQAASDMLDALLISSPKWFASSSEVFTDGLGWKLNFNQGQQWLLPFGAKAVHNVALLSEIMQERPWKTQKWRVNTRMDNRWFFREAGRQEVI